jgi:hypothetical protein
LPDGIFSDQKSQFGQILEGLALEDVGICYDHLVLFYVCLVYSVAIWSSLWPFGIFFPFWYVAPRKIWQPC